jgi:hypothetical protein
VRRALPVAAALGAAAFLTLPAAAGAATARATASAVSPGVAPAVVLRYDAAPGEANRLTISPRTAAAGEVDLSDSGAIVTPGPGCSRVDDHTVACVPALLSQPGQPAATGFERVEAKLGDRPDTAGVGGEVATILSGEGAGDTLSGGSAADVIDGGTGRDKLTGGAGADRFVEDDESARDDIDGGPGGDRVDYARRRRPVSVDLTRHRGADGDRLESIQGIGGGRGNDRLTGGPQSDTIDGGDGNDTIFGKGGADLLRGDRGTDTLSGGPGPDKLDVSERGAAQADTARCGSGGDTVLRPAAPDRVARDCEHALLQGSQGGSFAVSVSQPLRAGRTGEVEIHVAVPKGAPRFRGRAAISFNGVLMGRPSRTLSIAARRRTTARVTLVGPALTRLRESHRLLVQLALNDAVLTTVLRAPLPQPGGGGGTGGGTPA